ncbi:MAG TPA: holo-ACP synthase [Ohtaekwangia sp.]|uniref:holo-ACP synthase n=1 Tax=Ohtaekwangia sp. TaxID=2066019 RepID=UPI002F9466F9
MIVGTGIDIIEVERVEERVSRNNGFTEKVFAAAEIAFCEGKKNKAEHYAVRFAAKEAFLKATGKGLLAGHDLHEIEVVADDLGKPGIILHGNFREQAVLNNWNKIHVSLSHVKEMACAVVIIEQ